MNLALALGLYLRLGMSHGSGSSAANFRLTPTNGSYRLKGYIFELWNPTTSKWHAIYPFGPDGAVHTAWGAGEITADDADGDAPAYNASGSYRYLSPNFELYNPTTAKFHVPSIDGGAGAEYLTWGDSDATANPAGSAFSSAPTGANFRVTALGIFQLTHRSSGLFHTIYGFGAEGAVQTAIAAGES